MEIHYKRSTSVEQLKKILDLQKSNLPSNIEAEERKTEGFLTVHHTLELLVKMQNKCPHIIAISGDNLAGYALCMHPVFANQIAVLRSMFDKIKRLNPENRTFMVMGQICIDKPYRKKGVFRGLYDSMRSELKADYDMIITEVDHQNSRSLDAHYAIGFTDLLVYKSDGRVWHLVRWIL
ncbi:MAG: N-acetyltransferase [Flavobacteriaceae bacterium]